MSKVTKRQTKRLFIGIPLPPQLRQELFALMPKDTDLRLVEMQKYHITLVFIGKTDLSLVDTLSSRLQEVASVTEPFSLHVKNITFMPSHNPRMVWLQWDNAEAFSALVMQLKQSIAQIIPLKESQQRHIIPHTTLARGIAFTKTLPSVDLLTVKTIHISSFSLFASHLQRSGAEYHEVTSFSLK